MSTSLSTRHPLTITYTLMVSDEVLDYIKESDGTRYWVYEDDFSVKTNASGVTYLLKDGQVYFYDNESALKGISLWIQNGGEWESLKDCGTDHYDHDAIWQYGFFGELVYG